MIEVIIILWKLKEKLSFTLEKVWYRAERAGKKTEAEGMKEV